MIELTEEEKKLLLCGLHEILNEIDYAIDYPYWEDDEDDYLNYYNNRKQQIKQLMEKLS